MQQIEAANANIFGRTGAHESITVSIAHQRIIAASGSAIIEIITVNPDIFSKAITVSGIAQREAETDTAKSIIIRLGIFKMSTINFEANLFFN